MPDSDVTCTLTNTRKIRTVTLVKKLSPDTDGGKFNLNVNSTTATDQGNNGQAQDTNVPVGSTVTISEAAGAGTNLGNYTPSLSCPGVSVTDINPATFTMPDSNVTCTLTNLRKTNTVTLVKSLSGGGSDTFDLTINATTAQNQGNGGQSQVTNVPVGSSVSVSEIANASSGANLANYTSSLSCPGTNLDAGSTTSGTFTMPTANVTCTLTNTRKTHKVTLTKALVPSNDAGKFNLTAAGITQNDQVHGGSAQNTSAAVGTSVTVSEAAGTGTNLGYYTSSLSCTGVTTTGTTSATFTMPDNDVSCTVTNTRRVHKVTLIKTLVPSNDPGKFNLTAAGTVTADQGNGGSAQNNTVSVGTSVTVSEAAGTGTILTNYTSSLNCDGGVTATETTSATFTMPDNDVTCTVTNTRKTHKVTLTKALVPSNDPGKFNLTAAGTVANDQGHGGFAQNSNVAVGTSVTVSEAAGAGTDLAGLTASLNCTGVTATGTTSATFTMPDNDVSCTVTNTRKTHKVTLTKTVVPSTDPGKFNLTAAGTTAADQSDGGSAQNTGVGVGALVTVSEAAGTNTNLGYYTSSLSCTGVTATGTTSATFTMPDSDVSCTVINTRKTHKVTLTKTLVPSTDPGRFNLTVAGTTATDQGNGGSVSSPSVAVGTSVTLSEAAGTDTNISFYTSSLSCLGVTPTGTSPATFTMPDNDVACTLTNTRRPTLTITKVCAPSNDTTTQFSVTVGPASTSVTCGGSSVITQLNAGTYSVSENTLIGWNGALPSGWQTPAMFAGTCTGGTVTLANGQNVTCFILNVNNVCTPQFPPLGLQQPNTAPSLVTPQAPVRRISSPARTNPAGAVRK
jgi:hypothetical protein